MQDPIINIEFQAKEKGSKPPDEYTREQSIETHRLMQLWDQLEIKNRVLWRRFESKEGTSSQLIVPREIRKEVLHELHAGAVGGHLGEEKTLGRLKERFYWPGHFTDVRNWCKTCAACAMRKTPPTRGRAPLKNIQVGYPMQMVAMDILGPLPESDSGNSYLLVASDYFTRWVEVYAIPNQEALTVAKKLVDEMFCRFSPPEQLHSDQGRQFESELIQHICDLLQIKKTRTTPYHPQGDGLVERFNRTLLDMLATTAKGKPFHWEDHVRKVSLAYNSSIHPTTGYTPFYLMFGRQARLPVGLMFRTDKPKNSTPAEYATQLRDSLEQAFGNVRATMGSKLETQKQLYDHKVHGEPFTPRSIVWLHSPAVPRGESRKLHHPWTGPWKVLKRDLQDPRPEGKAEADSGLLQPPQTRCSRNQNSGASSTDTAQLR